MGSSLKYMTFDSINVSGDVATPQKKRAGSTRAFFFNEIPDYLRMISVPWILYT